MVSMVVITFMLLQFMPLSTTLLAAGENDMKQTVEMRGKIEYSKQMGCYTLVTEDPPTVLFIVNENKKVLERLNKKGQTIVVKGHFKGSADYLIIDQIDGKKYKGKAIHP